MKLQRGNIIESGRWGSDEVLKNAILSDDGKYRYSLTRTWSSNQGCPPKLKLFVGLNPSTADHTVDDPTIRRLTSFTKDWGYNGFVIINLFAYRSSDSNLLRELDPREREGPENCFFWRKVMTHPGLSSEDIVFMWGSKGNLGDQATRLLKFIPRGMCFGMTKSGDPKHPLYLPSNTKLIPYEY